MRDPNTTPTKLSWARFFHLGLVRSLLNSPLPVQVRTIEQKYRETYREHTSTHFFLAETGSWYSFDAGSNRLKTDRATECDRGRSLLRDRNSFIF